MHGKPRSEPPVLDLAALVQRLGGDARLAARLLADFRRTQAEIPDRIAEALPAGRTAEAHRLSHLLAGLAANLGLPRLSEAARAVENALSTDAADLTEALERLSAQVTAALAAVDLLPPAEPAAAAPAAAVDIGALAASLDRLLAANDLDAIRLASELAAADPTAGAVRHAAERLDFAQARALLASLLADGGRWP